MSLKDSYVSALETLAVAIPAGANQSAPLDLGGLRLFAIAPSVTFLSCNVTFQMSPDGGKSWFDLLNQDGQAITALVSPAACTVLDPKQFACLQHLRINFGSAQSAACTLSLIARAV